MKGIRDAQTIIGLLEDGDLNAEYTAEIAKVLDACREQAGPKRAAKGSVTLKLEFVIEGVQAEVSAKITSSPPSAGRGKSFFFITEDGLSTEHPRQINLFPEDAEKRRGA